MIVDRVKISKEFFVMGSGEWITAECQIMEGDDWMQVVQEIKQKMISMYGGNGISFAEHQERLGDEYGPAGKWNTVNRNGGVLPEIQIANLGENSLTKDIESCNDIKVLESYKIIVKNNPSLRSVYDKKMSELLK